MIYLTTEQAQQIEEALMVATTPLAVDRQTVLKAMATIRAAKAQEQPKQEPVGYFAYDEEHNIWEELTRPDAPGATPLYAAPVRTKDLTGQDLCDLEIAVGWKGDSHDFEVIVKTVIAADRSKNK